MERSFLYYKVTTDVYFKTHLKHSLVISLSLLMKYNILMLETLSVKLTRQKLSYCAC